MHIDNDMINLFFLIKSGHVGLALYGMTLWYVHTFRDIYDMKGKEFQSVYVQGVPRIFVQKL